MGSGKGFQLLDNTVYVFWTIFSNHCFNIGRVKDRIAGMLQGKNQLMKYLELQKAEIIASLYGIPAMMLSMLRGGMEYGNNL